MSTKTRTSTSETVVVRTRELTKEGVVKVIVTIQTDERALVNRLEKCNAITDKKVNHVGRERKHYTLEVKEECLPRFLGIRRRKRKPGGGREVNEAA